MSSKKGEKQEDEKGEELIEVDESGKIPEKPKKEEKKSTKPCKVIAAISIIVLLVLIGGAAFYFLKAKDPLAKERRCIIFGYGGVAMSSIPILDKKLKISEFVIVDGREIEQKELDILGDIKYTVIQRLFDINNLESGAAELIKDDDIVLDFFGMANTIDIIKACHQHKGVVYLNAAIEEFPEVPNDSLYQCWKRVDDFNRYEHPQFTGCIEAGANPGMVTHFSILALFGMAESAIKRQVKDYKEIEKYLKAKDIKKLAEIMQVDAIHISEHENLEPVDKSIYEGFVTNTWCPSSFQEEWSLKGEISVGTNDAEFFYSQGYEKIKEVEPENVKTPYPSFLKSFGPEGIFTGKITRHPEVLEISKLFANERHVPTVAFVYKPSVIPRQSMYNPNWKNMPVKLMLEVYGPLVGQETMGAALISSRDDIKPRFYGSVLSAEQSREVGCMLNPTTLQVAAGVIGHITLALKEPNRGLCMPHEFDSYEVMKIAKPYLGTIADFDFEGEISSKYQDLMSTESAMNDDLK